jgi:NAD(P)-dependent dehydrogenase (short-subunit alcohol dehydrogenase family)
LTEPEMQVGPTRNERSRRSVYKPAKERNMSETNGWIDANIPAQNGKLVLVTGANSGLGYEVSRALARRGATVIMACRDTQKGEEAAAKIREEQPKGELRVMELDLSDLSCVRKLADEFRAEYKRLDALVNNAGVMAVPYGQTTDGFELHFGINHLGHFALTGLLLDLLKAAPGSRVVTVSSYGHWFGWINFGDLNGEKFYYTWLAYGQSKLANVLFAYELQRRLARAGGNPLSLAAHPGYAATNLQRHSPLWSFLNPIFAQSQQMGALPILYAAARPEIRGGEYLSPDGFLGQRGYPYKGFSSPGSHNKAIAQRLWQVSEQLTGVKYEI